MSGSLPSSQHSAGHPDSGGHSTSAEWAKDQTKGSERERWPLLFQMTSVASLSDTPIGGPEMDSLGQNDSQSNVTCSTVIRVIRY